MQGLESGQVNFNIKVEKKDIITVKVRLHFHAGIIVSIESTISCYFCMLTWILTIVGE